MEKNVIKYIKVYIYILDQYQQIKLGSIYHKAAGGTVEQKLSSIFKFLYKKFLKHILTYLPIDLTAQWKDYILLAFLEPRLQTVWSC